MKGLLISIAFYISFITVHAQSYQPFAVEGAHWRMNENYCYHCDPASLPYPSTSSNYCFQLHGDTLVNNILYKRLFVSSTTYFSPAPLVIQTSSLDWGLIGLVREDTVQQRVYIRGITGYNFPAGWCGVSMTSDSLLYDFARPATDSLKVHFTKEPGSCFYDSFAINSIDTQNIFGAFRRVVTLNDSNQYYLAAFRLIEGIGYSFGLFGTPGPSFEGNYITRLDGYCVGPDSICGTCYTKPVGVPDLTAPAKINIYPNPADDHLTITTNEMIRQVAITDISGKVILSQNFNDNKVTLPLSGLSRGLYICRVYLPDGEVNRLITIN